ncbi:MAG TPA: YlaH-like family protein [Bacillota bacterium]|nr:YlaH-like family protein [Bacillota bacterium]
MIYDFIVNHFGSEHLYAIFYILNLIFAAIAYELGFAKKLSVMKTIFVYILLAIGIYILTIFSILPTARTNKPLPITESLVIICVVLGIYRYRLHLRRKAEKN